MAGLGGGAGGVTFKLPLRTQEVLQHFEEVQKPSRTHPAGKISTADCVLLVNFLKGRGMRACWFKSVLSGTESARHCKPFNQPGKRQQSRKQVERGGPISVVSVYKQCYWKENRVTS